MVVSAQYMFICSTWYHLTVIYDLWSRQVYYFFIFYGCLLFIAEDGWCAKEDKDIQQNFLQVDFLLKTRVTRVGVLRRKSKDHWVEKYSLQYSDDDITWTDYLENGYTKVGNIQLKLNE